MATYSDLVKQTHHKLWFYDLISDYYLTNRFYVFHYHKALNSLKKKLRTKAHNTVMTFSFVHTICSNRRVVLSSTDHHNIFDFYKSIVS